MKRFSSKNCLFLTVKRTSTALLNLLTSRDICGSDRCSRRVHLALGLWCHFLRDHSECGMRYKLIGRDLFVLHSMASHSSGWPQWVTPNLHWNADAHTQTRRESQTPESHSDPRREEERWWWCWRSPQRVSLWIQQRWRRPRWEGTHRWGFTFLWLFC